MSIEIYNEFINWMNNQTGPAIGKDVPINNFMMIEGQKIMDKQLSYTDYEMQWIGDFNPKMVNIAESLGTTTTRKLITYRYLFDRKKEFVRHKMLA